ncbi:spermidine synthase [Cohnella hongkongensis]|uniref:Spermidine synthase n=1 Tax=Cohnella hongkongensis TaxID=178337 RepID=A0ABV9FL96_9BACL
MKLLAEIQSPYNEIAVYETAQLDGETGRFRCVRFADGDVQGAMDLRDPQRLVLAYQKALAGLMVRRQPLFASAFMIGYGIGSLSRHFRGKRIVTAEIDQAVVEVGKRYFGAANDDVRIGDGRLLLEAEPDRSFDFIVLDAFTSRGTPPHLTTESFFRMASDKLRPGGALFLNAMGRPSDDRHAEAVATTMRQVFADVRCRSLPAERSRDRRNMIFAGSDVGFELSGRKAAGLMELELVEVELAEGHVIRDGSSGPDISGAQ